MCIYVYDRHIFHVYELQTNIVGEACKWPFLDSKLGPIPIPLPKVVTFISQ